LDSKKAVNKALLRSGAGISDMNTVRKKLSAIKGGRLAIAAYPAKITTYMISDVPGDDPSVIASGPTVPDLTTVQEAKDILEKYDISVPEDVIAHLQTDAANPPAADHPAFENCQNYMIAIPQDALQAAAAAARAKGIEPVILGDSIEGEAAEVAKVMAGITRQVMDHDQPSPKPCVILSGGETTVTVKSEGPATGRGGRNAEFLLAFAEALGPSKNVYALAVDTDGIDGTEDNAGAILHPDSWRRADKLGLSMGDYLARHDAYNFFKQLDDLIITGPTRTNVNDFRAILVLPT
jgi:hydroxypyruvate reductase